jgi:hypothetical protein
MIAASYRRQLDQVVTGGAEILAGRVIGAHEPSGTLRLIISVQAPTAEAAAVTAAAAPVQATAGAAIGALRVTAAEARSSTRPRMRIAADPRQEFRAPVLIRPTGGDPRGDRIVGTRSKSSAGDTLTGTRTP